MPAKRRIRNKILSILLCICMIAGMLPVMHRAAQPVQAGVGAFFAEYFAEKGMEMLERSIVYGLEQVSDDTSDGINFIVSLMHSAEENKLVEVLNLCEEILETLTVVDHKIDEVTQQNQVIIEKLDKQTLDSYNNQIVSFNTQYERIYNQYMDVLEAVKAYEQDETDDKWTQVKAKYAALESFYEDCESGRIDLMGDITQYAEAISPYRPSYKLQDESEWELIGDKSTYFSAYLDCVKNKSVSQGQVHDAMENALNYATIPVYYYMLSLNLYNGMKLQKINENAGYSATERSVAYQTAWNFKDQCGNYAINAINQSASDCWDILSGYRWKIDEEPTIVDMDMKKKGDYSMLDTGYAVTLSSNSIAGGSGKMVFTDMYGRVLDEDTRMMSIKSGQEAYIKPIPASGSHLSQLTVQGAESSKSYDYTEKNGIIAVTVPASEGLTVAGYFKGSGGIMNSVSLYSEYNGSVEFVNHRGELHSADYLPGAEVHILAMPEEVSQIEEISVTDAQGNPVSGVDIETNDEDIDAADIYFRMPDYNVSVTVRFAHIVSFTMKTDDQTEAELYLLTEEGESHLLSAPMGGEGLGNLTEGTYRLRIHTVWEETVVSLTRDRQEENLDLTWEDEEYLTDFTVGDSDNEIYADIHGTSDLKGTYYIYNYQDYVKYRELMNSSTDSEHYRNAEYILMSDIVIPEGYYIPINSFSGILDGNGYEICSDMWTKTGFEGGLITELNGGTIKNLTVRNIYIQKGQLDLYSMDLTYDELYDAELLEENDSAGIIADYAYGDVNIENCKILDGALTGDSNDANIIFGSNQIGGLIAGTVSLGKGETFTIRNCEVSGYLYSSQDTKQVMTLGGMIGYVSGNSSRLEIENSHFSGTVAKKMSNDVAGGFVGFAQGDIEIQLYNVYVDGSLGTYYKGEAFVGASDDFKTDISVISGYYLDTIQSQEYFNSSIEKVTRGQLSDGTVTEWMNDVRPELGEWAKEWIQTQSRPMFEGDQPQHRQSAEIIENPEMGTAGFQINESGEISVLTKENLVCGNRIDVFVRPADGIDGRLHVTIQYGESTREIGYCRDTNNDCYVASFLMPDEDVFVTYEFENEDVEKTYQIRTETSDAEKGAAWITDAEGNEIHTVQSGEVIYLNTDLKEGIDVGNIWLYSGTVSGTYYKVVDPKQSRDEEGRYVFTVDSEEAQPDPNKMIIIHLELTEGTYTIGKDRSGVGLVELEKTSAKLGEEVRVKAVPGEGYFCSRMYLLDENGEKLQNLWTTTLGGETQSRFTMPGRNVTVYAVFRGKLHNITVETNSEDVTIQVLDSRENDITMAKTGSQVTVRWDLDRAMFDSLQVCKANLRRTVLEELSTDGEEAVFTMPSEDVVIVANADETMYKLKRNTEGEGYVMLNDLTIFDKENGKAGQTIFAALYPADGWKIKEGSRVVDEAGQILAELDDARKYSVFVMPQSDITLEGGFVKDDTELEKDEEGSYLIHDFDELQMTAKAIQSNPTTYARASFRLTNPIHADGQQWTLPIGTKEVPFNGSFEGAGYYLLDYTIDTQQDDMALFGVIGEDGQVSNMGAAWGRITSGGNRVAELVAVNYGTIDGCYSGSNLTGGTITTKKGMLSLEDLNTTVTGSDDAAGLVTVNYGTIRNSRSHAKVSGARAAGLVLQNYGVVENGYNYGEITGTALAAGVIGSNAGSMDNLYNSGVITSLKGAAGAVIAENMPDGTPGGHLYYDPSSVNAQQLTAQGTEMELAQMRMDAFKDTLNANGQEEGRTDWHTWMRESNKNNGYPRISSPMIVSRTLKSRPGKLSVQGEIHSEAALGVKNLNKKDSAYQAFKKHIGKDCSLVRAQRLSLEYRNGDEAEFDGILTITLHDIKKDMQKMKLLAYTPEGQVREIKASRVGDDYVITLDRTEAIALTAKTSSVDPGAQKPQNDPAKSDKKTGKEKNSRVQKSFENNQKGSASSGKASVKTGDTNAMEIWLLLCLAGAMTAAGIFFRRRKFE